MHHVMNPWHSPLFTLERLNCYIVNSIVPVYLYMGIRAPISWLHDVARLPDNKSLSGSGGQLVCAVV